MCNCYKIHFGYNNLLIKRIDSVKVLFYKLYSLLNYSHDIGVYIGVYTPPPPIVKLKFASSSGRTLGGSESFKDFPFMSDV